MKPFKLPSLTKAFETEITDVMRDFKVPGMSLLIQQGKEVLYERGFGYGDLAQRKPATSNTLYGIASMTKSLTCLAILILQKEGKLNVHDPISDYLPVDLTFKNEPVTLHHAMSHSTGMPCLNTYEFIMANQGWKTNIPILPLGTWDDFYHHLNEAKSELLSPPGTKYYYWNGGFTLLGQIIEKISGMPYEEYLKTKLLNRVGMTRSTFFREDLEADHDVSMGYNYDIGFKRSPKLHLSSPFISAAGGLNSSVKEITNYLQFHLKNGYYENDKIVDEQLLKEMYKPHNAHTTSKNTEYYGYNTGTQSHYGYGIRVYQNYFGHTLIAHYGFSGFSGGMIGIIPELSISVAQLYNVAWIPAFLFHYAVISCLGKDPHKVMPFIRRRTHYTKLCGEYLAFKNIAKIKIENRNGLLHLIDENWLDKDVYPLIPTLNSDPEIMTFYTIQPFGTLDVYFTENDQGQLSCHYERRIFHKEK
jgi:CubicO group peptidase (beta-lactamase class C family)